MADQMKKLLETRQQAAFGYANVTAREYVRDIDILLSEISRLNEDLSVCKEKVAHLTSSCDELAEQLRMKSAALAERSEAVTTTQSTEKDITDVR